MKEIRPMRVLQMPNVQSINALAEVTRFFYGSDGGLLLAPEYKFTEQQIAAAEAVGGRVMQGYEFLYPAQVVVDPDADPPASPGWVNTYEWCAYPASRVGYALSEEVAARVAWASIKGKKEGFNPRSLYDDILAEVVENARLVYFTRDELEGEIEFVASRLCLREEQIAEAIDYAHEHHDVEAIRERIINDALDISTEAAREEAEEIGAQAHPDPNLLRQDIRLADPWRDRLEFGPAWNYWPEPARERIKKAAEDWFRRQLPWLRKG